MLVGWYIDILIGYLIRILIQMTRARGSSRWPLERAKVTGSNCDAAVYGGPVAEVTYTYAQAGEYFSGTHREPFILRDSAEEYAARFPAGGDVIIRVQPGEPEVSIVREDDQAVGILK